MIEHHATGKDGQPKPLDATAEYWSGRALFVHNVKRPEDFVAATRRKNLSRLTLTLNPHPNPNVTPVVTKSL